MNKQISLAILVVGVVLVIYGISASNSFSSDVSRAFTGSPTDRTMWFLGVGAVLAVVGGYGMTGKSN